MLIVPDEIKELYHQDHCYKNIRIHFPNGERSDICNDLIVKDSVSFKESLCSQNELKFGLCESPIFECETVGVGNIKGATIEVACEIECPSTVTGAEWRADLQKYIYSIPYGIFIIDSCKRQAGMIHRKIVAYKEIAIRKWDVSTAEKVKQIRESNYTPNLGYFLAANGIAVIEPYTTEEVYTRWSSNDTFTGFTSSDTGVTIRIEVCGNSMLFYESLPARDYDALYRAEMKSLLSLEQLQNKVAMFFLEDNLSGDLYKSEKANCDRYTSSAFRNFATQRIGTSPIMGSGQIYSDQYLYPYLNSYYSTQNARYGYYFPTHINLTKTIWGTTTTETIYTVDVSTFKAYKRKITDSNVITDLRLSIPTNYPQDYSIDFSQFSDIQDLANSYAELLGIFSSYNRDGSARNVNIKRQFGLLPTDVLYPASILYPQGVTGGRLYPQNYQSCWYDDYYIKPFGRIDCQYKNTSNEDCLLSHYLAGYDENTESELYQVYSLANNSIIKAFLWTQNQIETICNYIASNIEGVTYIPVDFVGRGLPYVEAGDTFEILTKSNDSITTIVLNRTITGEQTLVDEYTSV